MDAANPQASAINHQSIRRHVHNPVVFMDCLSFTLLMYTYTEASQMRQHWPKRPMVLGLKNRRKEKRMEDFDGET